MNINDYVFESQWVLLSKDKPTNAKRVLLTNGDTIVIGSLTTDGDVIQWLFDRSEMEGYNPIAWMELPSVNPIKKHEMDMEQTKMGI